MAEKEKEPKEDKPKKGKSKETKVIAKCDSLLDDLTPDERKRVLSYLTIKYTT